MDLFSTVRRLFTAAATASDVWRNVVLTTLVAMGIGAVIPFAAVGQVNVEPFTLGTSSDGFRARIGANFKMEANETVLLEIDLSPRFDYTTGRHTTSVLGTVEFSERAGNTFRDNALAHLRHLVAIREGVSVEGYGRIRHDTFAALRRRVTGGAGLRFRVATDSVSATYAGVSGAVESELWAVTPEDAHPSEQTDVRTVGYLAYRVTLTETTTLLNTIGASWRMAGTLEDVRVFDAATLQVTITEQVALTAAFGFEYDSRPPQTQPQVTMTIKNGITIQF